MTWNQQVRSGLSVQQAFEAATHRIGPATVLRAEFENADKAKLVRVRKQLIAPLRHRRGVVDNQRQPLFFRNPPAGVAGEPAVTRRGWGYIVLKRISLLYAGSYLASDWPWRYPSAY